jgi:hypothetical protein
MNKRVIRNNIWMILVLGAFLNGTVSSAQPLSKAQIDSLIIVCLSDISKLDTLSPFVSTTNYYKTLSKHLKFRTSKGETVEQNILSNNSLISYRQTNIIVKRKANHYQTYTYYFLDSKLVKFRNTEIIAYKNGKTKKLKHRVSIYFDKGMLIEKETEIRDNYTFSEREKEIVMNTGAKKLLEFTK